MQIRKLIFLIVAIVTSMTISTPNYATAQNNNGNHNQKDTTILKLKPQSHRPRIPGMITITAIYADDIMEFELPSDAAYMNAYICNESGEEILSGIVTPNAPALQVRLDAGEYTITCTTNTNQVFTGTLCI